MEHIKSNYAKRQPDVFLGKQENGWWIQVADKDAAIEAYREYQDYHSTQEEDSYENINL